MQRTKDLAEGGTRPIVLEAVPIRVAALACLLAMFLVAPVAAQNPEFEGMWRIDLERSDPMNREGLKVGGTLELSFSGDDLKVVRTFDAGGEQRAIDWTFITDGKVHEIPGFRAPREARTKWRKAKLNVSYSMSFPGRGGVTDIDTTETWSINKKGELEVSYATRLPNRTMIRKEIYVREEGGAG